MSASTSVVFASRECNILQDEDLAGRPQVLTVRIMKPRELPNGNFEAVASVSCSYFSKEFDVLGSDGIQALACILKVVHGFLLGRSKVGFKIWWLAPNDLSFADFWAYDPDEK